MKFYYFIHFPHLLMITGIEDKLELWSRKYYSNQVQYMELVAERQ
ncbi:hypothetical protein C1A50_3641 [Paenibacillus polymyxa]|nr:hypothetical protein C1A50_3641 [Paenibacillus polymyxa]